MDHAGVDRSAGVGPAKGAVGGSIAFRQWTAVLTSPGISAEGLRAKSRAAWPKQTEVGRDRLAAFECEMSVKTRLGAHGLGRTSIHQAC
jgi:hypothetical protein